MEKTFLVEDPALDWASSESYVRLSPRLSPFERSHFDELIKRLPDYKAHIWLATSGSRSAPKLVGLSKMAMLAAAGGANRFLGVEKGEAWLCALPTFHVGGLSIFARAHLSASKVHLLGQWDAEAFVEKLRQEKIVFSSLVPTQLYDVLQKKLQAPPQLRAILVGGDALSSESFADLEGLGWKLVPCYGMTETSAFFAASKSKEWKGGGEDFFEVLPHAKLRTDEEGRLEIQSPTLCTAILDEEALTDPKRSDGFFKTSDRALVVNDASSQRLRLLGRSEDLIKIGGELVNMSYLQAQLSQLTLKACFLAFPDQRLGHVLHLALEEDEKNLPLLLGSLLEKLRPFERPRSYSLHKSFPRSHLGKIQQTLLSKDIGKSQPLPASLTMMVDSLQQ